jgi:hypothetical protein
VELERRTTDHPFGESLDTLNDPLPDQLCHTRPVVSNQTGSTLPGSPYYISLDLPPDYNQFFPSRKDDYLPLLTALGPCSKQPTNPPSPPLLAWRGWERAGRPTKKRNLQEKLSLLSTSPSVRTRDPTDALRSHVRVRASHLSGTHPPWW